MYSDSNDHKNLIPIQIAIDGPASAGKSTVAKLISKKLGFLLLDTGAMYRSFSLLALRNKISGDASEDVLSELFCNFNLEFSEDRIYLNGEDVTETIRTREIDEVVSFYASNPAIRKKMVTIQQQIASQRSVVMEGRDICTVVLVDTPHKFYLDASVEVRARRRYEQNIIRGIAKNESIEAIRSDIIKRDELDSTRSDSPLRIAPDCTYIDTSELDANEICEMILNKIMVHLGEA
jgi:cytidylate kinase